MSCKIIAVEGIDGSGKNLQVDLLYEKLQSRGLKCHKVSFPDYEGFFGTEIGKMLKGDEAVSAKEVDGKSMALWYALDRWNKFKEINTADYDVLLLNRYTLSNVIYQSLNSGDKEFEDWIFKLEHEILNLPKPDIYILLDVNQEISRQNVEKKGYRDYVGEKADVYEDSSDLMAAVRKLYLDYANRTGNVYIIQSVDNNQMRPFNEIHDEIFDMAEKLLLNRG